MGSGSPATLRRAHGVHWQCQWCHIPPGAWFSRLVLLSAAMGLFRDSCPLPGHILWCPAVVLSPLVLVLLDNLEPNQRCPAMVLAQLPSDNYSLLSGFSAVSVPGICLRLTVLLVFFFSQFPWHWLYCPVVAVRSPNTGFSSHQSDVHLECSSHSPCEKFWVREKAGKSPFLHSLSTTSGNSTVRKRSQLGTWIFC